MMSQVPHTRAETNPWPLALMRVACRIGAMLVAIGTADPAAAANCKYAPAPNVDWHECSKGMLMLGGSDLSRANLADADFTSTDLRQANLTGANLEKATLVRASLAGATADKANFARIEAYRANFTGASAVEASFVGAELQRADLSKADLTATDFEKAELGRVSFAGATITGTRFRLANLSRADFQGAVFEGPINFEDAFLFLTRFDGLDLSAATGLTQAQVDLTCGNADTKLPAGLTAPKGWPCTFTFD